MFDVDATTMDPEERSAREAMSTAVRIVDEIPAVQGNLGLGTQHIQDLAVMVLLDGHARLARITGGREGMTVSEIRDSLGLTQSRASDAVARLAKRDLVSTRTPPGDGRMTVVELTPKGWRNRARRRGNR